MCLGLRDWATPSGSGPFSWGPSYRGLPPTATVGQPLRGYDGSWKYAIVFMKRGTKYLNESLWHDIC